MNTRVYIAYSVEEKKEEKYSGYWVTSDTMLSAPSHTSTTATILPPSEPPPPVQPISQPSLSLPLPYSPHHQYQYHNHDIFTFTYTITATNTITTNITTATKVPLLPQSLKPPHLSHHHHYHHPLHATISPPLQPPSHSTVLSPHQPPSHCNIWQFLCSIATGALFVIPSKCYLRLPRSALLYCLLGVSL